VLALRAEVIEVLDDPLSDALLVKDVLAGEKNRLFHIFVADGASEVVELSQFLSFDFL
jgi:hypothetical protein